MSECVSPYSRLSSSETRIPLRLFSRRCASLGSICEALSRHGKGDTRLQSRFTPPTKYWVPGPRTCRARLVPRAPSLLCEMICIHPAVASVHFCHQQNSIIQERIILRFEPGHAATLATADGCMLYIRTARKDGLKLGLSPEIEKRNELVVVRENTLRTGTAQPGYHRSRHLALRGSCPPNPRCRRSSRRYGVADFPWRLGWHLPSVERTTCQIRFL